MFEILSALLVALAAAWGASVYRSRLPVLRQRVLVPLRVPADHAVRGVLLHMRGPWAVIADAVLVRPDRTETAMPGQVVVHRDNAVLFQSHP